VIDNVAKHLGLDRNEVQRKTCDLNCDGLPVIPELPESWTWIPASCLYTDARYGTSVKCEKELAGGVAVLRVPNIARGVLDVTDLKFARLSGAEMARLVVKEGDIVVCRTNGSLDLIGKAAVIPRSPTDYAFASYLIRLRLEQSLVLPKYFHCLISSALGRGQIQARARTTAGQFNLNLEILGSLAVALPSTEEQAEIISRVDRLLTLADLIEERVMKAASCSGSLTQSILAKAFRGELVPTEAELARRERRDYEPASVLLERIKAEKVSLDSRKALRTKRPAPRSGKRSTVSA
jgi:type I restriction enzyme S subunit